MERLDRLLRRARHELTHEDVAPYSWAGDLIRDGFGLNEHDYELEGGGYDLPRALEDATRTE